MFSIIVACSFRVHIEYVAREVIAELTRVDLPDIDNQVATAVILLSILFMMGV
uniref:Uncharacterized protein n=1 Tax=Arundo donax TaxID=35708 RepID=A0A0A8YP29_ARUDO